MIRIWYFINIFDSFSNIWWKNLPLFFTLADSKLNIFGIFELVTQNKTFEDVTLDTRNLWWVFFTINFIVSADSFN